MSIIIHRGNNQIGGNCIEIASDSTRIIFDIGEELPEVNRSRGERNVPNVANLFTTSTDSDKEIDAIFISHIHGDHIGLIDIVRKAIPIYMGKYAYEIWDTIREFTNKPKVPSKINFLINGKPIKIKDITVTPFLVDHSAFDSYGFLIECNGERIFYTGDFRSHGFAKNYTLNLHRNPLLKEIDVLLIEGTNLYKDEYIAESEEQISERIEKIINETKGNVFVLQSSANIARIQAVYKAAKAAGRIMLVDIFTVNILNRLPRKLPNPFSFDDVHLFYPKKLTNNAIDEKPYLFKPFARFKIPPFDLHNRKDMVILIRESMVIEVERRINTDDSCLIYSKWTRYKEDSATANFISRFDKVIDMHTSGHADIPSIKNFVDSLNPKVIMPIHTNTPYKYVDLFGDRVFLLKTMQ